MSPREKPGLPAELEKARKQAQKETDAMTERARKKAEQDFANIDIPIKRPK